MNAVIIIFKVLVSLPKTEFRHFGLILAWECKILETIGTNWLGRALNWIQPVHIGLKSMWQGITASVESLRSLRAKSLEYNFRLWNVQQSLKFMQYMISNLSVLVSF